MSDTTGADSGSLAVLSAGAAAIARAADLDTALAVIVEAGAAAVGAGVAAVFAQDPERGSIDLLLTLGMARTASPGSPPMWRAIRTIPSTWPRWTGRGRSGVPSSGPAASWTGVDLPLVVAAGSGVEDCVGVLTFGWAGDHAVSTAEETILVGTADLAAAAIALFRLSSMVAERAEVVRARVAHRCADRPRECAHGAPRPRASGWPAAPGLRRVGGGVRHR
ncbi:MAG: hypothetical protein U0838_03920 [Chloroflexota bacterium]